MIVVAQVAPSPAREGRYSEHQFEHGASGLFGEELSGPWLSKKEALRLYRKIFIRYRLHGDDGILARSRAVFFRGHQLGGKSFAT
jgi:hypothetical protein